MPWNRNDPDPLEIKRRKLAEQERLLAEQMSRLSQELHQSGEQVPEIVKPVEPPVWRLDDDATHLRRPESVTTGKRNLARQTQRDMIYVLVFVVVLLLIVSLFLYLAYAPRSD